MAQPGRTDGRITKTHGAGAGFSGIGAAGASVKPDPTFVFGGTRDANGNPVAPGFSGTHPVPAPAPFVAGVAPSDAAETQWTTPTAYVFNEATVSIPSALWEAVAAIVAAVAGDGPLAYNAVAIPYVTHDGEDSDDSPIVLQDYGLTDAWVTDYTWLKDNGLVLKSASSANGDPVTAAGVLGLDANVWGCLGSVTLGGGKKLLIYTTVPGFFALDTLVVDPNANANVFNTGTWDFIDLGESTWGAFIHTQETGINAPTSPARSILMFEGGYTGHSETSATWSDLTPPVISQALLVSRWSRRGTDFAVFLTGLADPRGLSNTVQPNSSLEAACRDQTMRVTDEINGSWIEGTIHEDFNGHLYVQAINDQSDPDVPPQDRPLLALTLLMDITDRDLSGGGSLAGGQPVEGDHLQVSFRGQL